MSTEWIRQLTVPDVEIAPLTRGRVLDAIGRGVKRRWLRERRRRRVARAYDMALEIARVVPPGSEVLDIGCGNGFIAHHLSALLSTSVIGIDVMARTDAAIDYRQYDGAHIPLDDNCVDAVLLCYVLHHAQNASLLLREIKRVLQPSGVVVIYEDIPQTLWDRFICFTHNLQWQKRTGACTFRDAGAWRDVFNDAGLEITRERPLSRLRNLAHPVCRRFFVLREGREINARETRPADQHNRLLVLPRKSTGLPSYSSPAS